jgi:hypothetical protein
MQNLSVLQRGVIGTAFHMEHGKDGSQSGWFGGGWSSIVTDTS